MARQLQMKEKRGWFTRRTREKDAVVDVEALQRREEQSVRAALEALTLIDNEAVPTSDFPEDCDVLLESFVRSDNDVWRRERSARAREASRERGGGGGEDERVLRTFPVASKSS